MQRGAPRGEAGEIHRFRRLIGATIVATFILIVHGGVVRVSESGLGCGPAGSGTHGWPLCEGGLLPPATAESLIEFSHRLLAAVVAGMILLLAWRAFRHLRERTWLVRGTVAAGVLVVIQALLGGLVVEQGLQDELVAAHLGLATLLIGLLIMMRRAAAPERPHAEIAAAQAAGSAANDAASSANGAAAPAGHAAERGTPLLRKLAIVAAVLLFATIVSGGYVAGTERMGTPQAPVAGAHMACGAQFPGCLNQFMPFGTSRLVDIHLTHRLFMYLAALALLAMVAVAVVQGGRSRAFPLAGVLLAGQVLLGATNVWSGIHAGLIVGHLALGTLLWSTTVYATSTLVTVSEPKPSPVPEGRAATETAAA